jgi:hypothetical protein
MQQLASSPSSADDYLVSLLLQAQAPTGVPQLTINAWTFLPTLALGEGWGDFNIQASVTGVLPASNVSALGDQIQTNVAFQYRVMKITANKLGRSAGAVRQKILQLGSRRPRLGTRSAPEHLKALASEIAVVGKWCNRSPLRRLLLQHEFDLAI